MITVDASVWVSAALPDDVHHAVARPWLAAWTQADTVVVPMLVLSEVAGAVARRTANREAGHHIAVELAQAPRIVLVPMNLGLATAAAYYAAELSLRGADAVYVAVARLMGTPLFTWDREQRLRAQGLVDVRRPTLSPPDLPSP